MATKKFKKTPEVLRNLLFYGDGRLIWRVSLEVAGFVNSQGYICISYKKKHYREHRLIWEIVNGEIPEGKQIDHIDNNKQNNHVENLRLSTQQQNMMNTIKRKGNSSKYKGVSWHKGAGKWQAYISSMGKRISLGLFVSEQEASMVYDEKAKELFGNYARLNHGY